MSEQNFNLEFKDHFYKLLIIIIINSGVIFKKYPSCIFLYRKYGAQKTLTITVYDLKKMCSTNNYNFIYENFFKKKNYIYENLNILQNFLNSTNILIRWQKISNFKVIFFP